MHVLGRFKNPGCMQTSALHVLGLNKHGPEAASNITGEAGGRTNPAFLIIQP